MTTAFAGALLALAFLAPSASATSFRFELEATDLTKTSATLNGRFATFESGVKSYFEWGETEAYGHTTAVPPGPEVPGPYYPFQTVPPAPISGLTPGTTYHYRMVNLDEQQVEAGVGPSYSEDATFTTPVVENLRADPATAITETSADLNGSFDGDGVNASHYYFEWGLTTGYDNTTPVFPGSEIPAANGRIEVPPVPISGLSGGGSTYHYRLVVTNVFGSSASADRTFRTGGAPLVTNLNTRNVQATSAELTGEINPRAGQTTYHFEWGPTASYGNSVPVPAGDVGSGFSAVPVSAQVEGLLPGLTYHFRLVATSPFGTTASPDQTFGFYPPPCPNSQLRQETRSNGLPDCRAYELVTPGDAQGTTIVPLAGPTSGLATNPPRLAYSGLWGLFPRYTGEAPNSLADLYISTRTDGGWTQRYIGLSGRQAIGMGGPPAAFLPNLYLETFPGWGQRGVQATPSLDRVINYNWGYTGNIVVYQRPSNAPYLWDVASGSLLERWPSNLNEVEGGNEFVGLPRASTDFSHFVFSSNVVFAPGGEASPAPAAPPGGIPLEALWPREYVYDNDVKTGTVVLASIRTDGTPFEGRTFDVSEDGSHILMTDEATLLPVELQTRITGKTNPLEYKEVVGDSRITGPLYLRVDGTTTYEIAPGHTLEYAGSTADGATVYLTSDEQLSAADHDSSRDLYVWHESEPAELTLVSIGDHGNSGDTDACSPNESWTSACGISTIALAQAGFDAYKNVKNGYGNGKTGYDGSQGNGVSDNYLSSKSGDIYFESPEQLVGAKGEPNERNLYLYRGGSLRYVATMRPKLGIARIQVTPDGRYMAFSTGSSLTDYDTGGKWQMYRYEPQSGQLICASCRPDNQLPVSDVAGSQNGLFLTYDGRVFYSTNDALVPRDTNQVLDVYEYTEGKAQLITTGAGAVPEGFPNGTSTPGLVNVSANGTDVYFATTDTLVTQDHNGASTKIYDARTGGGFPAEREEPSCVAADECHGPGASPPLLPADRTSAGFGTPRKAKAHKAKKHKKAHKHKKHKKKHAGKAKRKSGSAKRGGKNHG
ncbi:MAG: hypothetical protein ABW065_14320 [Solirubrobacterales bacterium]